MGSDPIYSAVGPLTIRQATPADLDALERFQQGIIAVERRYDPLLRDRDVRYYDIAAMLADPAVCLLLAETDGVPVGCAFARIDVPKPWLRHAREAYMGLMFVEPAWRGQGVNTQLLTALKAWCREQGVSELRLDVYADNTSAVRAYRKAGFRPSMVEMRASLAPAPDAGDDPPTG